MAEKALEEWLKKYGKVIDRYFFKKSLEMGFVMATIFVGLLNMMKPMIEAFGELASGVVMTCIGVMYLLCKKLLSGKRCYGRNRYA